MFQGRDLKSKRSKEMVVNVCVAADANSLMLSGRINQPRDQAANH